MGDMREMTKAVQKWMFSFIFSLQMHSFSLEDHFPSFLKPWPINTRLCY